MPFLVKKPIAIGAIFGKRIAKCLTFCKPANPTSKLRPNDFDHINERLGEICGGRVKYI